MPMYLSSSTLTGRAQACIIWARVCLTAQLVLILIAYVKSKFLCTMKNSYAKINKHKRLNSSRCIVHDSYVVKTTRIWIGIYYQPFITIIIIIMLIPPICNQLYESYTLDRTSSINVTFSLSHLPIP